MRRVEQSAGISGRGLSQGCRTYEEDRRLTDFEDDLCQAPEPAADLFHRRLEIILQVIGAQHQDREIQRRMCLDTGNDMIHGIPVRFVGVVQRCGAGIEPFLQYQIAAAKECGKYSCPPGIVVVSSAVGIEAIRIGITEA